MEIAALMAANGRHRHGAAAWCTAAADGRLPLRRSTRRADSAGSSGVAEWMPQCHLLIVPPAVLANERNMFNLTAPQWCPATGTGISHLHTEAAAAPVASMVSGRWEDRNQAKHTDTGSRCFSTFKVRNRVLRLIPKMVVSSLTGSPC
jgi:hypothetical protein